MTIRGLIFDLDGTLLDTLEDISASANEALRELGFPTHTPGEYRYLVGEGVRRLFQKALPAEENGPATVERCAEAFARHYQAGWNVRTRPYDGIEPLLASLVELKLPLAVLSNKPDPFTQACVAGFFPSVPFAAVIGHRDAVGRKPDPSGALAIARTMDIDCRECLYVGDTAIDMQTARRAAMPSVGVLWGFRGRAELAGAGAQYLVASPEEILAIVRGDADAKRQSANR